MGDQGRQRAAPAASYTPGGYAPAGGKEASAQASARRKAGPPAPYTPGACAGHASRQARCTGRDGGIPLPSPEHGRREGRGPHGQGAGLPYPWGYALAERQPAAGPGPARTCQDGERWYDGAVR